MRLLLLLSIVLIAEGFGIPGGRTISFYIFIITPALLFLKNYNEKIVAPKNISILFLLFIFLASISTAASLNVQKSFEHLLIYISSFLIFIYSYNHKSELKDKIITLIFVFSFIFVFYSELVLLFQANTFIQQERFQFVFLRFGHNQLGNFLLLPISFILYSLVKKGYTLQKVLLLVFFIPFFILSYSRSAYLDLLILIGFLAVTCRTALKKNKGVLLLMAIIFSTVFALFVLIPKDLNVPILSSAREFLSANLDFKDKYLLGNREDLLSHSVAFTIQNPLLGIGPGNFYIASEKYAQMETTDSYNIFLDILVENGILSLIVLVLMTILIFKGLKMNVYALMIFVMFLNFQTDYTYRFLSFSLLFFVLLGIAYDEKHKFNANKQVLITSLILFIVGILIFASSAASTFNNSKLALTLYPLNEDAHIKLIDRNEGNLNLYSSLFSDYTSNYYLGDKYYDLKDHKTSLYFYKKAYDQKLKKDMMLVEKINLLKSLNIPPSQ